MGRKGREKRMVLVYYKLISRERGRSDREISSDGNSGLFNALHVGPPNKCDEARKCRLVDALWAGNRKVGKEGGS